MKKQSLQNLVLAGAMAMGLGASGCILSNEEEGEKEYEYWQTEINTDTGLACKDVLEPNEKQFDELVNKNCGENTECADKIKEQKEWCVFRGSDDYWDIVTHPNRANPIRVQIVTDSLENLLDRRSNIDPITGYSCESKYEKVDNATSGSALCACRDLSNYLKLIDGDDNLDKECTSEGYLSMGRASDFEWECSDSLFLYYPDLTESGVMLNGLNPTDMAYNKKRTYCAIEQFAKGLRGQEIEDACYQDYNTFYNAYEEQGRNCNEVPQILRCFALQPADATTFDYAGCGDKLTPEMFK
ncbi:MAG: hypothetical protein LBQ87_05525 [Candidatus Fibromonas sp.]|nr:hypothetical protein [Candidatus Fibromonas sp.]